MIRPDQPRRYCRKCVTPQAGEEFFEGLQRIIKNLDEELKVPEAVYEQRLDSCMACESLLEGMCRICGCYVELRSAMKKNACPAVHPKWGQMQQEEEIPV